MIQLFTQQSTANVVQVLRWGTMMLSFRCRFSIFYFLPKFLNFSFHQFRHQLSFAEVNVWVNRPFCWCWGPRTFSFIFKYIRVKSLVFAKVVCHVLNFILFQLITMHLSHIKVNSVRSCSLTHQVLGLFFAISCLTFLEIRSKSTVLIFFLYFL